MVASYDSFLHKSNLINELSLAFVAYRLTDNKILYFKVIIFPIFRCQKDIKYIFDNFTYERDSFPGCIIRKARTLRLLILRFRI